MGFYFRKSKSLFSGLIRLNFSKSGVSTSLGVKGARVNFGSRGTYVNFGSNGIYYRKKISGNGKKVYTENPKNYTTKTNEQHTITSNNLEEITDTDSQDFINELTEKDQKISYYNWLGIFPFSISLAILFYIFFFPTSQATEAKYYIEPTTNVNIRQDPNKLSKSLGIVNIGQQFELIDESNLEWYKIKFDEQKGFISKQFSEKNRGIINSGKNHYVPTLFYKNKTLFFITLTSLIIAFSVLLHFLKQIDNKRLLVEIYYDIDEDVKGVYEKFVSHFSKLLNSSKVWQYLHSVRTNDYKYTSGAAHTITRKPLLKISANKKPSRIFKTNVQVPYLGLINTELYFFPERLVIKRGNEFAAIMYKNIDSFGNTSQFIESDSVPNDSEIIDYTWRYLNKNGTPDRRFNNNHKIPICRYNEYTFKSNSGLNEKIATSKVGIFDDFIRSIKNIGKLQNEFGRTIGSANKNIIQQSKIKITITDDDGHKIQHLDPKPNASIPYQKFYLPQFDELFQEAAHIIVDNQQGSASLLQRKLQLGYNRAGRLIDELEETGIVGSFDGEKSRDVLIKNIIELNQILSKLSNGFQPPR